MKTNCNEVKNKVREHILHYYTPEELKIQADAVGEKGVYTYSQKMVKLVNGACFLVSYYEMRCFLESLNLNNNSNKKFSDDEVLRMYTNLISREGEFIINHLNQFSK